LRKSRIVSPCTWVVTVILVILWIFSFPGIGNWLPHELPRRVAEHESDLTPPSKEARRWMESQTNVSKAGAVPTFRVNLGTSTAFCVVLWKGSIHCQLYTALDDSQIEPWLHVTAASYVVNFYGIATHWTQEPYFNWDNTGWNFLGFMFRAAPARGYSSPKNTEYAMAIPIWSILMGLTLPVLKRRPKRPRQNICKNCGYDLHATPDLCPECGKKPSTV